MIAIDSSQWNVSVCSTLCSLLLSVVSGEGTKERTDRVVLTPWVKFLWESYRNMLELLKNNYTVLKIYADVAKEGREGHMMYIGSDVYAIVT